jgi:hypothetical protein
MQILKPKKEWQKSLPKKVRSQKVFKPHMPFICLQKNFWMTFLALLQLFGNFEATVHTCKCAHQKGKLPL